MKQSNCPSDLISMSSFAGKSYLTILSFVCIILITSICNLNNLCQTESSFISRKPHQQCVLNFNEQITRVQLQPSIRPIPAQVILRLLFVLATEHTLLRMFLNIWRQILFPGDLLFRISVQLSVKPLIAHAVCNSQQASAITRVSVLLLNYRAYPT